MKKKAKLCKNGHPIMKYASVLLFRAVVVCDACGTKHVFSSLPCVYVGDEKNPAKEVFHVFVFSNFLFCTGCHKIMTLIRIACNDLGMRNWDVALEELTTEKKDENLCGTSDNRSDV